MELAGTMVKRASLHNADQIAKLDIREGDTVFVEKGGEIIPKVIAVDLSKRPENSKPAIYINRMSRVWDVTYKSRRGGETLLSQ